MLFDPSLALNLLLETLSYSYITEQVHLNEVPIVVRSTTNV